MRSKYCNMPGSSEPGEGDSNPDPRPKDKDGG